MIYAEHKRDIIEFWKNKEDRIRKFDEILYIDKPHLKDVLRFEHVGLPARALLPSREKLAKMCVHLVKHAHYSYGVFRVNPQVKYEFADAIISQKREFSVFDSRVRNFLVDASFLPDDMILVVSTLPIEIVYMSNFSKFRSCMTIKGPSQIEIERNKLLALAPGSIIAYAYRASEPRIKYWRMLMHVPLEDIERGKLSAMIFMRQYPRSHVLSLLTKMFIERIAGVELRRPRSNNLHVILKTNKAQHPPYIDPFDLRVAKTSNTTYTFQLY